MVLVVPERSLHEQAQGRYSRLGRYRTAQHFSAREHPHLSPNPRNKLPRSKLRGIQSETIVIGAAAPKPPSAHSSRQQVTGHAKHISK